LIENDFTKISVGFEVLTAVVMQIPVFWDILPCVLVYRHHSRESGETLKTYEYVPFHMT
jgi:hypothetical protein